MIIPNWKALLGFPGSPRMPLQRKIQRQARYADALALKPK